MIQKCSCESYFICKLFRIESVILIFHLAGRQSKSVWIIVNIGELEITRSLDGLLGLKSKSGEGKITTKMNGLLDKSLPFYKKALDIDAKNEGALETLKTIYAFRNDTKNYEEIKKRLDALPKQ